MKRDSDDLIDRFLDDVLTQDQQEELSARIKSDPEYAGKFARAMLMHNQLRDILMMSEEVPEWLREERPLTHGHRPSRGFVPQAIWRAAASVAVLAAGIMVLWFSFGPSTASAAYRELDRILIHNVRSKDRTYEIVVEDVKESDRLERRSQRTGPDRPPKPPLDKAILHVREGNQFVLIRKTADGLPFITGCDGRQSWAVNTKGPVRVSSDVQHFNHDLPGHETSIPLIDLNQGIERLKESYRLQFSATGPEEYASPDGEQVRVLLAVKKPKVRGPQRVEIAYGAHSGKILCMRFVQMPYGPDRLDLRLSLTSERELPDRFFEHQSHHDSNRLVVDEE